MEEYLVNDDISLGLQKSEKIDYAKFNYDLIPKSYEIFQMKWLNQDFIPILYTNLLTDFFVSKTVNHLRPYNFFYCTNLEKVEFEDGINISSIPKNCFSYLPLKKIIIPESVCVIEKFAFFCCSELEEVNFSSESKLEIIKENAFCKCIKLTKINLPPSCKMISRNCFSFTGLKSIQIPNSIKKIEINTFYHCKELSNVILNNGLLEICENSFAFNSSLKSIDIPDSLTTIKSRAFYKCINLTKVNTTEKTELVEIEDESFDSTQIEELSINRAATKLFDSINMPNLNIINFYNGKPFDFIQLDDGTIYEKNDKIKDKIQSSIPELEEKMNQNLFISAVSSNSYCSKTYISYKKIKPKDVTKDQILLRRYLRLGFDILLKRNRLNNQPLLNLLFIPNNLQILKIHEDCFSMSKSIAQRISNLTTIEYLNGLTNYVFTIPCCSNQLSKNLKNIKIMGDYSYIQEGAFSRFKSIEKVEFGLQTNISIIQKNAFLECEKLQQISIPSSCISIEEGAFKNCISLVSVHLPSNLKYIRKEAFFNCSSLESIEIPSTVLIICEGAFMNCTKLYNVEILAHEKGLELIGKNAFRNCTSLKSFVLPKTVFILGPSSFMNCKSLENFEYEGKYLLSIQCRTFFNCISLKSIKMKNISYINNYESKYLLQMHEISQWSNYIKSKNIDIDKDYIEDNKNKYPPDILKYIEKSIFSIEAEAFMNCISLTDVIIEDESKEIDTILYDTNNRQKFRFPVHDFSSKIISNHYNLITVRQTVQRKAFYNCKSLQHVSLFLGNLESFDDEAFSNCSSLKTIDINSKYSSYLINEKLDMKSFCNTSNELVIKLFNHGECINVMNLHNYLK